MTVAELQPVAVNALARDVARDKAQVARLLANFEGKGLVRRVPSGQDGRVTLVSLTQEGQKTVEVLQGSVAQAVADVLRPLAPEEAQTLAALLRKVGRS